MIDSNNLLNSANKLFLKKHFADAVLIYEKILYREPKNLDAINNKGYALSKLKKYHDAIRAYDLGLKNNPLEQTLVINKISALRKMNMLNEALHNCNNILKNSNELIVKYHKLRILFSLKKYQESLQICDEILYLYPNNPDVLFDKALNLALLGKNEDSIKSLNSAIAISKKFRIKAKNNKSFHALQKEPNFLKLVG